MLNRKWTWTILGVAALVARIGAHFFSELTEKIYSRAVFPVLRTIMDHTFVRLPFPIFYLFLMAILLLLGKFLYRLNQRQHWKNKGWYTLRSISNFTGAIVFFFLLLWGYNYQRLPFTHQLKLDPSPLNKKELLEEAEITENALVAARSAITNDTLALEELIPYHELENMVREEVQAMLEQLGLYSGGHPRTKAFYPQGTLRRLGIVGIYFPFTGESYIDPTLHHLEKPFTVAHEMAHSYGITDEGEANFFGWLVCSASNDPLLQYAGQLQLFRYQLNDIYRTYPEKYREIVAKIHPGVLRDIASIQANSRKIKAISSELSRKSNDLFLKSQGVTAGVRSYSQLTMLVFAWRAQHKD